MFRCKSDSQINKIKKEEKVEKEKKLEELNIKKGEINKKLLTLNYDRERGMWNSNKEEDEIELKVKLEKINEEIKKNK